MAIEFKKKADVVAALDAQGIEYKKIMSGANAGKATQSFKELIELFVANSSEKKETKKEQPIFHRKKYSHNSMTWR